MFVPLLDALRSSTPDVRLASLRATHALATRAGAILRLRVGTPEFVDALWSQLLPTERPADPAPAPDADADAESPPSPAVARARPPAPQVFHALRAICAAVFPDWETASHVVGAPPDAPVALARDLTPLTHLLRPGVLPHDAVREKAARLARLLARSRSGRDALCREPDAGGGLLEALAEAARSNAPEDAKLRVIAARLVTALARDDTDAAAAAARLADSGATRALFETLAGDAATTDATADATTTDDAVREAAAMALARMAATSETAARSFVSWGALDTIAATLPAPDRFQTPPPTPPPDEEDNVFADAFGGRRDGFVDEISDARRAPAIPSMTGDVSRPKSPGLTRRTSRTPGLTAALFDLLAALTRHDAIREEACARGGLAEARGLLPGGGHRPTWTGVALHSAIPAVKAERDQETRGGDDANDEGADGEAAPGDGEAASGDEAPRGGDEASRGGDEASRDGDGDGDGDASSGSPGSPGCASPDWRSLHDALATSARLVVAPAGGDASSVPVLIRGDPPVDDASSCAAALRALETLARDARCRDELLADGGAGAKTLAAIVRRGVRGCVEPALRTLLLVVSAAEDDKTLAKTLADADAAASAASAASGRGAAAALELKRRAETPETTIATENDAKATAKDAQSDARDRVFGTGTLDPDESAYDVLTCDVVRTSVASVPLEDASASLRGAVATAMTSYPLSATLPPARPPAPDPPVRIEPPRAPLGRAHVRAPVRRAARQKSASLESAVAVDSGEEETKEKKEKREEGGEEEAGETLEIVTER